MTVPVAGRGFEILAVYGFFVASTTITVLLRVYCRAVIGNNSFGWDDGLAVAAWALFVCFAAFAIAGVHHGTGQHADMIKPATEIPIGLKFWWLCEPVYVLSNMAIKASIALQLLRISPHRVHRIILYTTLIVIEVFSAAFFFLFVFQCQPSSYFWTQYQNGNGHCIDPSITVNFTYAYSALTCVGDFTYAILPWLLVWNLQMRRKQKVLVGGCLALGAIASAATIARLPYIHNLSNLSNFLYATTDVAIWSCCETGLGITACCCATLRPLFRTLFAGSSAKRSGRESTKPEFAVYDGTLGAGEGRARGFEPYTFEMSGEGKGRGIRVERETRFSMETDELSDGVVGGGKGMRTHEFPAP